MPDERCPKVCRWLERTGTCRDCGKAAPRGPAQGRCNGNTAPRKYLARTIHGSFRGAGGLRSHPDAAALDGTAVTRHYTTTSGASTRHAFHQNGRSTLSRMGGLLPHGPTSAGPVQWSEKRIWSEGDETMPDQDSVMDEQNVTEFEGIKRDVERGKEPTVSVREFLRWFGASRRRTGVVERIEAELEAAGMRTEPDFTTTWINATVTLRKRQPEAQPDAAAAAGPQAAMAEADVDEKGDAPPDMSHLVRMLDAANRGVTSVQPQDSIEKAITLMLAHDFSQLAVMTGVRDLKGAISWKSIGSRLSQRKNLVLVSDAMEGASEVQDSDTLSRATKEIIQGDYVFVRSATDRKITGIVTATDLSVQFQEVSEPFLLLGRIENQIRRMIQNVFNIDALRAACNENDPERKADITKASQLTFGEYQRLLGKEENWAKLGFVACRKTFCKELDEVRKLRNEIMHFHPDSIEEEDYNQLRRFSHLLEQLGTLSRK
ncbi:MAG: hypothetical protein HQL38_13970 [Alphaproteobacteria bacterium]|nr:hypothetical protein [Alphaproteobacteria bacterium]MBF0393781.1 hypothetical protein [Alphaproteobacteria bacterium]